jgi:hypothetical protein
VIGRRYLAFFGPELTTGAMGAASLHEPVIDNLLTHDAASDIVQTPGGLLHLADQPAAWRRAEARRSAELRCTARS